RAPWLWEMVRGRNHDVWQDRSVAPSGCARSSGWRPRSQRRSTAGTVRAPQNEHHRGRRRFAHPPRSCKQCQAAGRAQYSLRRRWPGAMTDDMREIEIVVAHSERVTQRVGDVFLKIDTDQARIDREVEVMASAPIPNPEVLWRKP